MYSLPTSNVTYIGGMLSIRPNNTALLRTFSVEEESIKTYEEGFDLKASFDAKNNDLGIVIRNDINGTTSSQEFVSMKPGSSREVYASPRLQMIKLDKDLNNEVVINHPLDFTGKLT